MNAVALVDIVFFIEGVDLAQYGVDDRPGSGQDGSLQDALEHFLIYVLPLLIRGNLYSTEQLQQHGRIIRCESLIQCR